MKTRRWAITALALAIAGAAMLSQSAQAGGSGYRDGWVNKPEPVTNGGVSVGRGHKPEPVANGGFKDN